MKTKDKINLLGAAIFGAMWTACFRIMLVTGWKSWAAFGFLAISTVLLPVFINFISYSVRLYNEPKSKRQKERDKKYLCMMLSVLFICLDVFIILGGLLVMIVLGKEAGLNMMYIGGLLFSIPIALMFI